MSCKGKCSRAKDEDDYVDVLSDGTYFKLDQYGDIIGVTSITTQDFFNDDDEDEYFEDEEEDDDSAVAGLKSRYSIPYDGFACGAEINTKPQVIVDVDYVAELLQGLEPQELKYISKVCEVLIAEGEL